MQHHCLLAFTSWWYVGRHHRAPHSAAFAAAGALPSTAARWSVAAAMAHIATQELLLDFSQRRKPTFSTRKKNHLWFRRTKKFVKGFM